MSIAHKKPVRSAVAAIQELFRVIDESGLSYTQISNISGVHAVTLSYWRSGKQSPRLQDFENVTQALGYRISICRKEQL